MSVGIFLVIFVYFGFQEFRFIPAVMNDRTLIHIVRRALSGLFIFILNIVFIISVIIKNIIPIIMSRIMAW